MTQQPVMIVAKRITLAFLVAAMLHGCASQPTGRQCFDNFRTDGNILVGKSFTTYAYLPDTSYKRAFKNVNSILTTEGFQMKVSNPESGIINVYQQVSSSKIAPLNALVEKAGRGSKVTMTFVTQAGLYTTEDQAREHFCDYLDRAAK
ncbi:MULTISPECIES: hypothetical protein [unclassified Pseudomonas]|uniref:hypothetical protein n=1 Tax=unclassified Pseudomonas TaxID=196821 RepID=UPI0025F13DC9|nr:MULTISPECIES: hypothetical protein [unclassified Pseudomonas]